MSPRGGAGAGRAPAEVVRSLLADSEGDLGEVRVVRESLRQWDRGCFRAQQAAEKSLRALRVWLAQDAGVPLAYIEEHIQAIGEREPRVAALLSEGRRLDRYFLRTGLPLGVPQIHSEDDCRVAHDAAVRMTQAAIDALEALGFTRPPLDRL